MTPIRNISDRERALQAKITGLRAALAQPESDGLFVGLIAKHEGLADELAQPDSEPYAYAVYFPEHQREELVHRLDDLLDDMTNEKHSVTPLFDRAAPPRPKSLAECRVGPCNCDPHIEYCEQCFPTGAAEQVLRGRT